MSDDFSDILGEHVAEHSEIEPVIELLRSGRPVPGAAFRGQLARQLRAVHTYQPLRLLWLRVAGLTVAGAMMLGLVALGVDHHGPFAPNQAIRQRQAQIRPHIVAQNRSVLSDWPLGWSLR